ncbi:acyl carrier protein [candidate division KSB1 bacterium]|nr:acyl carrier protein [candidate division KSB1 bacterium]
MTNYEKLKNLLVDVFLLEPSEFRLDLSRDEIDSWDSLGVVSMAVGIEETFGYHLTPEEATGVKSVQDIMNILRAKGVVFDD